MTMADRNTDGFRLAQAVEVKGGDLAGLTGLLIGFRGDRCLIELETRSTAVLLINSVDLLPAAAHSASAG